MITADLMKRMSNARQTSTLNILLSFLDIGSDQVFDIGLLLGLGLDVLPEFFFCRGEVNADSVDFLPVLLHGSLLGFAGFGHLVYLRF